MHSDKIDKVRSDVFIHAMGGVDGMECALRLLPALPRGSVVPAPPDEAPSAALAMVSGPKGRFSWLSDDGKRWLPAIGGYGWLELLYDVIHDHDPIIRGDFENHYTVTVGAIDDDDDDLTMDFHGVPLELAMVRAAAHILLDEPAGTVVAFSQTRHGLVAPRSSIAALCGDGWRVEVQEQSDGAWLVRNLKHGDDPIEAGGLTVEDAVDAVAELRKERAG